MNEIEATAIAFGWLEKAMEKKVKPQNWKDVPFRVTIPLVVSGTSSGSYLPAGRGSPEECSVERIVTSVEIDDVEVKSQTMRWLTNDLDFCRAVDAAENEIESETG